MSWWCRVLQRDWDTCNNCSSYVIGNNELCLCETLHIVTSCSVRLMLPSALTVLTVIVNPLMGNGDYSATSNNMKLVHWPLMGRLLHLVQRGGAGWGPTPPRPLLAVPNVSIHQRPVYQSPYCCIMVRCSPVLMCPLRAGCTNVT